MEYADEDISVLIDNFIRDAAAGARLLAARHGLPIQCANVERALVEALGLDTSTDLLDWPCTQERILLALADYDFRRLFPALLTEVRFENSIVPVGVVRRLVEQTVRRNGEVWRIYRNDADPFPSNPHAHNLASGHKLHLGTGELFLGNHPVGKIKRKDLVAIRRELENFDLPTLACRHVASTNRRGSHA